jgi:EAL domain-containing protein (putative c-di-GMP-specific phosphodiesterase class I)
MRDGIEARSAQAGGADAGTATRSLARQAEALLRAGTDGVLRWGGVHLSTRFQPIYGVRKAFCIGFEGLVRAADSHGDVVAFENVVRATAAGEKLLLDWACRALHLRNFAMVDPGDRMLFINVDPTAAIRDARRAREFAELIRYYGLAPKRVCVEILETECGDEAMLREAVAAYRDIGVYIALDDFGTGASDIARVTRLQPDIVKVDRSILAASVGPHAVATVLPTLVDRLHQARCRVAIEGIETRAQAAAAIAAKSDYLQGFLFAYPEIQLDEEMTGVAVLDALIHAPIPAV